VKTQGSVGVHAGGGPTVADIGRTQRRTRSVLAARLIQTLLALQAQGRSIVLSSHNMEDIVTLAQEMTVMKDGKTLATGAVGEIFNDPELVNQASLVVRRRQP